MVNLSGMTDRSAPRGFPYIWYIRLVQIFFSLIVLAISAANASSLNSIACGVPGKLGYNIACVWCHGHLYALLHLTESAGCPGDLGPGVFHPIDRSVKRLQSPTVANLDSTWP